MGLKKRSESDKSNMYTFITDRWNPVRGECPYECSYCYVGRWGRIQRPLFLDKKDLLTPLGSGRFIFICSGCDLFHPDVPAEWITAVREQTLLYPDNKYLWHTKNPYRLVSLIEPGPNDIACVTIESEKWYPQISKAPPPIERITWLNKWEGKRMITVEPIMDFDLDIFYTGMILEADPIQVNIGADSGGNNLPEPPAIKIIELIDRLKHKHITVHGKKNLDRLLKPPKVKKHPIGEKA